MIRNFICAAPRGVFPVGPVEPVELREIRGGHVGPARGTGGTGVGRRGAAGVEIFLHSSTGPTNRFHQNQQTACSTTGSTCTHPRRCRVLRRSSVSPPVFMDDQISIVSSPNSSRLRP